MRNRRRKVCRFTQDGIEIVDYKDVERLRRYVTDRGKIEVSLATRDLGDDLVEAHFQVKDTGIGIAAEDLDRLFKPFSQIDASLTRKHGGTGLGLAICRRIAELHRGTIDIEASSPAGTSFRLRLPATRGARIPEDAA